MSFLNFRTHFLGSERDVRGSESHMQPPNIHMLWMPSTRAQHHISWHTSRTMGIRSGGSFRLSRRIEGGGNELQNDQKIEAVV